MLPFDNKSEFQVIVDMPAGTPVEQTAALLRELGAELATVPEVTDYQAYAGTACSDQFQRTGAPVLPAPRAAKSAISRSIWSTSITATIQSHVDCHARAAGAGGDREEIRRGTESRRSAARPAGAVAAGGGGVCAG
jgi:multidrug efflux pump subunit AcrB